MQSELNNICDYFVHNKLVINISKSTETIFYTKRPSVPPPGPMLLLYDSHLKKTNCFKYLGVILDSTLSWTLHTELVFGKLSRSFSVIKNLAPLLNAPSIKCLYFSIFNSYLFFSNLNWGHQSQNKLRRINSLQLRLIRIIKTVHPSLSDSFQPLTVAQIHLRLLAIILFRVKTLSLPQTICSSLLESLRISPRPYPLRSTPAPDLPHLRTEYGRASIFYQIIFHYHFLTSTNDGCSTINELKSKLKTYFSMTNLV